MTYTIYCRDTQTEWYTNSLETVHNQLGIDKDFLAKLKPGEWIIHYDGNYSYLVLVKESIADINNLRNKNLMR